MSNVYLSGLSQAFIHTMTGFLCQGSFYIPQADVVSLQKVSQHVFSDVEGWLDCFNSVSGTEQSESDLAEQDFLRLLQKLCTIFLQNSVILHFMFFQYSIWEHMLFDSPAYETFAKEVLIAHAKTEIPEDVQLRQAMPVMKEKVSTMQQMIDEKMNYWEQHNAAKLNVVNNSIQDILQGQMKWTIMSERHVNQVFSIPQLKFAAGSTLLSSLINSLLQLKADSIATFPALASVRDAADSAEISLLLLSYSMSWTLTTVFQAWQEWTVSVEGDSFIQSLKNSHSSA